MVAGVPLISITRKPWRISKNRASWGRVAADERGIRNALGKALDRPTESLHAMGKKPALIAQERFHWPTIASVMRIAYEWAIAGGPPPHASAYPRAPQRL
jgi:hypothetical protein